YLPFCIESQGPFERAAAVVPRSNRLRRASGPLRGPAAHIDQRSSAKRRGTDMPTILHRLSRWADEAPGAHAQMSKKNGKWQAVTAREYRDRVFHLALFLE